MRFLLLPVLGVIAVAAATCAVVRRRPREVDYAAHRNDLMLRVAG